MTRRRRDLAALNAQRRQTLRSPDSVTRGLDPVEVVDDGQQIALLGEVDGDELARRSSNGRSSGPIRIQDFGAFRLAAGPRSTAPRKPQCCATHNEWR